MTKIEKVRQYMEITGMNANTITAIRSVMSQMLAGLVGVAGLDEKKTADLTVRFNEVVCASLPGFLSSCEEALAETWTDEVADYYLEECQRPVAKAAMALKPLYEQKVKVISETWRDSLLERLRADKPCWS